MRTKRQEGVALVSVYLAVQTSIEIETVPPFLPFRSKSNFHQVTRELHFHLTFAVIFVCVNCASILLFLIYESWPILRVHLIRPRY